MKLLLASIAITSLFGIDLYSNPCWVENNENGEKVYSSVKDKCDDEFGNNTQYIVYDKAQTNAFEVSIRCNENANNLNVGIHVISETTNCFFDYRQDSNILRFRANSSTNWISYDKKLDVNIGEWFTLKLVSQDGLVQCYANNELKYSISNTSFVFNNQYTYSVSCWKNSVSFKNAKTYNEKIESIIPNEWVKTIENSEDVYTLSNSGPSGFNVISSNSGAINTISFDTRVNTMTQEYDGNVSAYVEVGTNKFLLEYNPAANRSYLRLRYFTAGSSEGEELAKTPIKLFNFNEYFNLKFVFADEYLAGYLNDELIVYSNQTYNEDLTKGIPGISAWCVKASVKNIKTFQSEIDYNAVGYLDLEFKSNKAVESFTANKSIISFNNDALIMSINGNNASITSPIINAPRGGVYSMKIAVRNTFCVRLKNSSSSDKLRLHFLVDTVDEEFVRDFDIQPFSDYTTYYFNISDIFDCGEWHDAETLKFCNHYLKQFGFEILNTKEGTISIDAITFEREDKLLPYRATEVKAIANKEKNTITFSGKLKSQFANQNITILSTEIKNYSDDINWKNNKVLATGKANQENFSITIPLMQKDNPKMTHLSTEFLVVASETNNYKEGFLCSKQFMIENWNDFSSNPYHFDLPSYKVNVLDFGANGDGFNDDTACFQKAIDFVSYQGGGIVNVPGDDSNPYGKRYIITTLTMKENVELHLEEGAILWQSQRDEDYHYDFVKTHDVNIPGAPWAHAAVSWNKPFIYIDHTKNVKITGKGTLRMADTGSECLDGNRYGWNGDITLNCGRFIHEHPIVNSNSTNVEVTDITILRNAIWTFPNINSNRIYIGNVQIKETSCINGDGFNFCSTSNVFVDRCTIYSNDDAMIISTSYYDPRYDKNFSPNTWGDNASELNRTSETGNIEIVHCNVFGGHGLTFIPWASNNPNEEKAEIYDIYAHDNVLGGTSTSVGVWGDNPFHGNSYMDTYNQLEANDFSPMRDITIIDNIYTDDCVLATWAGGTTYNATGFISDCGINSSTQFINGDFDKDVYFETDKDFVSGLANWTRDGNVGWTKVDDSLGYSGYIKGNGYLNQGLYAIFGTYKFSILTKLVDGDAQLKVLDALNNELIAEKDIERSSNFIESELEFSIEKPITIRVGVYHQGKETTCIYVDNASLNANRSASDFEITDANNVSLRSANDFDIYTSSTSNTRILDGKIYTSSNAEAKIMAKDIQGYEFSIELDIGVSTRTEQNCGVYLFANNVNNEADKIDALNVQIESKAGSDKYTIALYKFSSENGYEGNLAKTSEFEYKGNSLHLKIVVKNNIIFVFTDENSDYSFMYALTNEMHGGIGIRSQYQNSSISNFKITYKDYSSLDLLNEVIYKINNMDLSKYTENSRNKLELLLKEAKTYDKYTSQIKIDNMVDLLKEAINNLEEKPSENPPHEEPPAEDKKGCGGSIASIGSLSLLITLIGVSFIIKKHQTK